MFYIPANLSVRARERQRCPEGQFSAHPLKQWTCLSYLSWSRCNPNITYLTNQLIQLSMGENARVKLTHIYQAWGPSYPGWGSGKRKTLRPLEVQILNTIRWQWWELRWWACLAHVSGKTSRSPRCIWRTRSDQSGWDRACYVYEE